MLFFIFFVSDKDKKIIFKKEIKKLNQYFSLCILVSNIAKKISEILCSGFTLLYKVSRLKKIGKKDVSSDTNNVMKRFVPGSYFVFYKYGIFLNGPRKTYRNLVIISVFSLILHWWWELESRKLSISKNCSC